MKKNFLLCACLLSVSFYIIIDAEAKMIPKGNIYDIVVRCDGANQKDLHVQIRRVTQPEAEEEAKHQAWVQRYWGTDCRKPKIKSVKKL